MRKYLIILILATSYTGFAHAQLGLSRNELDIGFNGGLNLNTVSFTPSIKQNMQKGFVGGFTARYICEKYFAMICSIQTEVNFSQRGWNEKIDATVSKDTYSRTMNYIEVPFMAHLAFGKEDKGFQGFINIGPQVAYLISEQEHKSWSDDTDISTLTRTNGVNYQYIPAQNKFDYGLVGGGGIEIKNKAGNFLLEGRYYFGLSDFFTLGQGSREFQRSANTTISVRLSYLIRIGKKK